MLWVTISDRIVRKASRPISTGRQTLTNASSPTNARSPTASTAHGSRWAPPPQRPPPPRRPVPAAAEAHRPPAPDARADERTAAEELEVGPEARERSDRDDVFAA